jgi:hypothetical protein
MGRGPSRLRGGGDLRSSTARHSRILAALQVGALFCTPVGEHPGLPGPFAFMVFEKRDIASHSARLRREAQRLLGQCIANAHLTIRRLLM